MTKDGLLQNGQSLFIWSLWVLCVFDDPVRMESSFLCSSVCHIWFALIAICKCARTSVQHALPGVCLDCCHCLHNLCKWHSLESVSPNMCSHNQGHNHWLTTGHHGRTNCVIVFTTTRGQCGHSCGQCATNWWPLFNLLYYLCCSIDGGLHRVSVDTGLHTLNERRRDSFSSVGHSLAVMALSAFCASDFAVRHSGQSLDKCLGRSEAIVGCSICPSVS